MHESLSLSLRHGDEQSPRRLRVKGYLVEVLRHRRGSLHLIGQVAPVAFAAASNVSLQGQAQGPGEQWQSGRVQVQRHATSHCHLISMTHEAEAGNVRTRMNGVAQHYTRSFVVKSSHRRHSRRIFLFAQVGFFESGRQDTGP